MRTSNAAVRLLAALALALSACAGTPAQRAEAPATAVAWERHDVVALQVAMATGAIDARGLVAHFLERIATIDDAGPRLNAVIEINPDAMAIAAERDHERAAGTVRGPLHGIPVLLKDNIDTDDRMATSAGSLALANHRPGRDATLVRNLREAGAVILGKTNLSEWANFRSTRSTSGWSGRGGQTRNPHVLDRNPCGSSSGSAVAVAAGLVPLAVGTETDGSIVCPASANGVVGIKPTLGLVSRHGIIPIATSQDTAGPLARSVGDAAALLRAMGGVDAADPATRATPATALDAQPASLAGKRIGVLRQHFGFHPDVDATMESALSAMKAAGAVLVDPVELPTHGEFGDAEWQVLLHEFHSGIDAYLVATSAPVGSLDALIEWNRTNASTELRWFGQEVFEMAAATESLDTPEYLEAKTLAARLAGAEGIDAVLTLHSLDALVAPTGGPAWVTDPVNGDHFGGGSSSAAAVAGYPNVTVPAGQVHGLPVGISFIGSRYGDARLIAIAQAFERIVPAFREPRFLSTLPADTDAP